MRIFVTNRLSERTTVHSHGILHPNGMDGVGGLTQPHIPAGKTYAYEFIMKHSGTFTYHPHHVMNAMGQGVPTMTGVDRCGVAEKIVRLLPDYMAMADRGMAEMGAMEMPLPDNTLPMMTGQGPFGSLEMCGMFIVVKIREGLARNDYNDPGWYRHPTGSRAYEWKGDD